MNLRNNTCFAFFLLFCAAPILYGQSNVEAFTIKGDPKPRYAFLDDYYYGDKILDSSYVSIGYTKTFEIDTVAHVTCTTKDILLVGSRWAKYQDEVKYHYDKRMKASAEEGALFLPQKERDHVYWASIYDAYLLDRSKKVITFTCRMAAEDYCIEEKEPVVSWSLTGEVKKIGPYVCQHAETRLGGRCWHAWFTQDVPISVGPWKLHGLPGLIVSAYDESEQYKFEVNSVSQEGASIYLIEYPYTRISRKQYNRMFREMVELHRHFINGHLTGSGIRYISDSDEAKTDMSYSLIEKDEK